MKAAPLFSSMDISATGLAAQRNRMNAIAQNIANTETTRTAEGGPYKRRITVLSSIGQTTEFKALFTGEKMKLMATDNDHIQPTYQRREQEMVQGVSSSEVMDQSPPRMVYNPSHPDANQDGYVAMPNINIVTEMVDMIAASRSYEANVTALQAAKANARTAIDI